MDILESDKYFVTKEGLVFSKNYRNTNSAKQLSAAKDHKGYLRVGLIINSKLSTRKVHRLIAECFLPNPLNKPCVNHKNGIKDDNRIENLEWVTYKENTTHAINNNLFSFQTSEKSVNINPKKGELNGQSVLTETDVLKIRALFKPRVYTRKKLSLEFGVSEATIKDVILRKSWKHI
jgi:hypothetical protein